MCGIAGVVSATRESNITEALVHHMCNQIVYRGPDDEGLYVADGAGLGMRRLSIIDLAGGHQPVFNEDRTSWIVYNGEIYNFPELRPELESRGHSFRTHTDTEVIIHLYEEMGADCVKKLRGMFALAIYDKTKRKLILARDRLGKKPLHYALHNGNLNFASEIKSILAVAPELAEVNSQGLLEYLYYGYVPDPITAFTGIHKLPPGHLLEFQDGQIRIRQYWDLPEYNTHAPKNEEECLEELEQRLFEATKIRLISDVPLGAFLSGGTDSSTVVALMARASSGPVKTFSIGFKKDDFNEADCARIVAKKFATDHHEMILEPDVVQTVAHLTSSLEEPFGDSSMLPPTTFRRWRASMSPLPFPAMAATRCLPDTIATEFTPAAASSNISPDGHAKFSATRFSRACPIACRAVNSAITFRCPGKNATSMACRFFPPSNAISRFSRTTFARY